MNGLALFLVFPPFIENPLRKFGIITTNNACTLPEIPKENRNIILGIFE